MTLENDMELAQNAEPSQNIEAQQETPADTHKEQKLDTETETKTVEKEDFNDNISKQKTETLLTNDIDFNQKLHDEILEKLDIKKQEKNQDIQEKPKLQQLQQQLEAQVKTAISQDFDKIQTLMKQGLINSQQGQNLKKQVLQKAFDKLVQTEKIKRALLPELQQSNNQIIKNGFEEFGKNNPDFFTSDGRKEVLNYLKSGHASMGKEELNKISDIIRVVEKAAIERYLQKAAHEKTLKDSNETAKQRLTANAQKTGFNGGVLSRTFTREQIGKMSGAEFTKYETAIMEQLKKGQIK